MISSKPREEIKSLSLSRDKRGSLFQRILEMGMSNASSDDLEDEEDSEMKARYDREEARGISEDDEESEPGEQDTLIMQRL